MGVVPRVRFTSYHRTPVSSLVGKPSSGHRNCGLEAGGTFTGACLLGAQPVIAAASVQVSSMSPSNVTIFAFTMMFSYSLNFFFSFEEQ
jgi:hypothetical protein